MPLWLPLFTCCYPANTGPDERRQHPSRCVVDGDGGPVSGDGGVTGSVPGAGGGCQACCGAGAVRLLIWPPRAVERANTHPVVAQTGHLLATQCYCSQCSWCWWGFLLVVPTLESCSLSRLCNYCTVAFVRYCLFSMSGRISPSVVYFSSWILLCQTFPGSRECRRNCVSWIVIISEAWSVSICFSPPPRLSEHGTTLSHTGRVQAHEAALDGCNAVALPCPRLHGYFRN